MNLEAYLPVFLFILVGIGVGLAPMALGKILGPSKPDTEKVSPYECGFEAFEDARMKFDVRYYLIAILSILFDLETAFLFPWGVALSEVGPSNCGPEIRISSGSSIETESKTSSFLPRLYRIISTG